MWALWNSPRFLGLPVSRWAEWCESDSVLPFEQVAGVEIRATDPDDRGVGALRLDFGFVEESRSVVDEDAVSFPQRSPVLWRG